MKMNLAVWVWISLQNRKNVPSALHLRILSKPLFCALPLSDSVIWSLSWFPDCFRAPPPPQQRYILKRELNQYWKQQAVGQKTISLLMHYCLSTPSLVISVILTNHIWKDNTECQIKEAFYSQIASPCTHVQGSSSGFDVTTVTVS